MLICFKGWGGAGIYDKFAEKFVEKVKELKVGNGLEEGVKQVSESGKREKERKEKKKKKIRLFFGFVHCLR